MKFEFINNKDAAVRTIELPAGPIAAIPPEHLARRRLTQLMTRDWTFENWLVEFHLGILPRQLEGDNDPCLSG